MVGVVQGRGPLSALSTWTRRCHRSTVHRPCALREEARKTWSMSYVRDPYNTLVDAKLSCLSFSSSPILSMNEHHFSPFLIPTTYLIWLFLQLACDTHSKLEIPLLCSLFCHFQSQNRKQIKDLRIYEPRENTALLG